MDAKRMNVDALMLVTLGAYLTAGFVVGTLYFVCLWWNARLLAERGGAGVSILLMLARFAVLGGVLTLAAREGAMPLLLMEAGILIARFAVMRGLRAVVL
jgi:F1F0 ATPase subunit 2